MDRIEKAAARCAVQSKYAATEAGRAAIRAAKARYRKTEKYRAARRRAYASRAAVRAAQDARGVR